jgi:bacillithiol system protein YtxJ
VPLKDRTHFLTTAAQVDEFLRQYPNSAVFKVGTCHKNQVAFAHVEAHLEARNDLPLGVIRVVESRAASQRVAELTGITHESPQIVLFRDGVAVFDRDNWDITSESVAEALENQVARV